MAGRIRIAAVSFANARPLLAGLGDEPGVDLVLAPPARCADLLAAGRVDAGLVPAVAALEGTGLVRVTRGVIAALRRARTVLLVSDRPISEARTVRLSAHSRTSNALARILLSRARRPVTFLPPDARAEADAAVVIGDAAFAAARRFPHRLDLASAWRAVTGLPFVFAVFCARPGAPVAEIAPLLDRARARGLARLEAIAGEVAGELGEDREMLHRYFTEDLHFEATGSDEHGLALFERLFTTLEASDPCETPLRAS